MCIYIFSEKKKKILRSYYRAHPKPLPIFASSAKWKAMRLQSLLYVHRTMEYCTFQFHSTIILLLHHDQYGYLSVQFYIHWYFRITSTWLYIMRISWIYICYFCMNIIHFYLFYVFWYSVKSQTFCTTYSRTPSLCLIVLLSLGCIKRILYYLRASMYHLYLAILLIRLKTFEFKGSNPAKIPINLPH